MKKLIFALLAMYALTMFGCATSAKKVEAEKPKPAQDAVPKPAPEESAVFGKVTLLETINDSALPAREQDAVLYLTPEGRNMTIKISCSDAGEFGVYLPAGSYRINRIDADDYSFKTDIMLAVPADQKAVYAGTVILDGAPSGIEEGTDSSIYAYTVRDEQKAYEARIKKALPEVEAKFYKSLFAPAGGIMTGDNPSRVFRSEDVERELASRKDAVEEVVNGVVISLSYIINPIWIFTLGQ